MNEEMSNTIPIKKNTQFGYLHVRHALRTYHGQLSAVPHHRAGAPCTQMEARMPIPGGTHRSVERPKPHVLVHALDTSVLTPIVRLPLRLSMIGRQGTQACAPPLDCEDLANNTRPV